MIDSNDINYADAVNENIAFFSSSLIFGIIFIYLVFVYRIGPSWMKTKTAYQLKHFISFYNIIQVATCLYLTNRIWNLVSWDLFNVKTCIYFEPDTKEREEFQDIAYKTFLLKIFELTDTIIFVLRKKQNQITYLHTFHHASTITLTYLILKYSVDSGGLFPIYLNSWVHVIMYSYYFFANICSAEVMKRFIMIKKSITIIQMIQFCFILGQAAIIWSNCRIPLILRIYYYFVVSVIFYGFFDFYKKAYTNSQANKLKK